MAHVEGSLCNLNASTGKQLAVHFWKIYMYTRTFETVDVLLKIIWRRNTFIVLYKSPL